MRHHMLAIAACLLPVCALAQVETQGIAQTGSGPQRATSQAAQTGVVTFDGPEQQQIIIRSHEPSPAASDQYRISFEALDTDGDGYISRREAAAHPTLAAEFSGVDTDGDGRLSREELRSWIR